MIFLHSSLLRFEPSGSISQCISFAESSISSISALKWLAGEPAAPSFAAARTCGLRVGRSLRACFSPANRAEPASVVVSARLLAATSRVCTSVLKWSENRAPTRRGSIGRPMARGICFLAETHVEHRHTFVVLSYDAHVYASMALLICFAVGHFGGAQTAELPSAAAPAVSLLSTEPDGTGTRAREGMSAPPFTPAGGVPSTNAAIPSMSSFSRCARCCARAALSAASMLFDATRVLPRHLPDLVGEGPGATWSCSCCAGATTGAKALGSGPVGRNFAERRAAVAFSSAAERGEMTRRRRAVMSAR